MSVTIKTELTEPTIVTSIKEEPKSSDEEDNCLPSVKATKPEDSKWEYVKLPPKKKRKFQGMKATQLWHYLQTDVIKFCQDHGLIAMSMTCRCGQPMVLSYQNTSDRVLWKCRKGPDHHVTVTIRKGTWFEKSHLKLSEILWIAYMWVHEYSHKSMLHESDNSLQTVIDWCTCCRDACRAILECKLDPLGGSINLVEVFECKIIESKISKKHKKNDNSRWVFIGVEQFSTKTVLIVAEDKKSETIVEIFNKYILPGTTVFGNTWNAYKQLRRKDFIYLTEKKSVTFFDSVNKTDMNTVEDLWDVAKRPPPSTNGHFKYELGSQFCEYIYRKSLSFASDAYLAFLRDIAARICTPHDHMDYVDSILPD